MPTPPAATDTPEPQVVELILRLPNTAAAQWTVEQIKALITDQPGASLDTYGVFPASVFDAPDIELEVEGVPA